MTNSCAMVTPALGTPSALVLTNATGLPVGSGITGLGTGVATALGVNVGSAGAFVTLNGALGTPSSGTATNLTGTAAGLTAGHVTTNANLTGPITSIGNATSIASQTGTGTTFVMSGSPSIASPTVTGAFTATGLVTNADLVNAATTVNGVTCTLGSTCSPTAAPSGTAGGDLSGTYPNPNVAQINGTSLAGLATGILKNTTATGVPSIAIAADFPTLNQNTTGSAAKWTTARTLAGNSVDGSANVAFPNKFIVQGTADAGLTGAQFMGALGTGIVKNTVTTGVQSIATGADLPAMTATVGGAVPTPPNNTTTFLRGDGTFATPPGTGINQLTGGVTAGPGSGSQVATVVTNANLTGPITSVGNATSIASQTGTGSKFVVDTSPTLVTPAITGLATGTGVASGATASTLAARDSSANISANAFLAGYATTATAAGTTTLVVGSPQLQYFTGSTTQTVVLPVASTLVLGQSWTIVNNSSGTVTVQSSGANTVLAVAAGNTGIFTAVLTSGTSAASWSSTYISSGAGTGTVTSVTCGTGLSGGTFTTTGTCALSSPVATANGGTALTGFTAANNALYSTSSSVLTAGTLPVAAGGTGATNLNGIVQAGTTNTLTVGYNLTPNNIGTVSSGTTTLAGANGNYQYLTNNGAFTLAAPASDTAIDLLITNGASAGAITFSGFTVGSNTGDPLTTTNTSKFLVSVVRINGTATYTIKALQ